jgi:hypothetical protein
MRIQCTLIIHANEEGKSMIKQKTDNPRYFWIEKFGYVHIVPSLFNYLKACKIYGKGILNIKCVSFFSTTFV